MWHPNELLDDTDRLHELAHELTPAETEVLGAVMCAKSNSEVSALRFTSRHTTRNHLRNLYAKLGITGHASPITAAVAIGYRMVLAGILPSPQPDD